jgi:CheY-like chemotaxis protein
MDDEQMIRALVTHTLQQCGYTVTACADGAEAVARYAAAQHEGNPYAAVLLDLTVPGGMGGAVAARQILAAMPEAKLIVFSGYSDDPVMADFRSYGFCAALTKPFRAGELAEVVTQVVADVPDP